MITFLFWNLNRKSLKGLVASLASQYRIDVIVLAECTIPPTEMLVALNRGKRDLYDYAKSDVCREIHIYTRFNRRFIPAKLEHSRLTIRHLRLPGLTDILLAATHFRSKLHWSWSSQAAECTELVNEIRMAERQVGHMRSVLVGDLNMHPFEPGVVNANGLHAVASRRVALRKTRIVQDRVYPFFYNPMWGLLGDASCDPPGTFYQSRAEHTAYFWHMFDQVLIRPDLLSAFSNEDLAILCSDGKTPFLTPNGLPDTSMASDHLPLLFRLEL